jgi:hypothetical protein
MLLQTVFISHFHFLSLRFVSRALFNALAFPSLLALARFFHYFLNATDDFSSQFVS